MPRPRGSFKALPNYRLHKPSGRAVVTLAGRDHYLGAYGSKESRDLYDRVVGEWLASGRVQTPDAAPTGATAGITVVEVIAAFWRHAQTYYRRPDGTTTKELRNLKNALRPLKRLYGPTPALAFGPVALRAVRDEMVRLGWCRTHINRQVNRIRHVFKWAAGRELVPSSVYHALQAVEGLKAGRSEAKESKPVKPVAWSYVEAIEPYVSRQVWAMVKLQWITGMRSGEVTRMTTSAIETGDGQWVYRPAAHKTQHHGHLREVYMGEQCKQILATFLKPDFAAFIFSPADAECERREEQHEARKTPPSCGNTPGSNRARRPRRSPGDRYTVEAYCKAIHAACDAAFPPPDELARQRVSARGRKAKKGTRWETSAEWKSRLGKEMWARLRRWRETHRWHPHQLRHSAGTRLRKEFGVEAAQVILGHKTLSVTEIYAEKNVEAARQIMGKVG